MLRHGDDIWHVRLYRYGRIEAGAAKAVEPEAGCVLRGLRCLGAEGCDDAFHPVRDALYGAGQGDSC